MTAKTETEGSALSRWLYRSTQFFSALLGRVSEMDMEEARRVLGPELFKVFAAMPGQYKLHMLAVYRRVREAGCEELHVRQAALLHDVGKYDPASKRFVSLPYRIVIVLLAVSQPGRRLLAKLSWVTAAQIGWRYPFYLNEHHAELGAQRVARHGASADVVNLIANHHNYRRQSRELKALQAADEES